MKKKRLGWSVLLAVMVLLALSLIAPMRTDAIADYEFYGSYSDVANIKDAGGCTSLQGMAVGSKYLYTVKINGDDTKAFISMVEKETGAATTLYNADSNSNYFTYLGHANDMDVCGIDGPSNLFIATMKKGAQGIVRLKRDGNDLTKVAQYHLKCGGEDVSASAIAIVGVKNGQVELLTKTGTSVYTGTVSTAETNATVEMTKLCTIVKSQVYVKDTYYDLTDHVNQGMGYHKGLLYVPVTGDADEKNRSHVLVYDLNGASGKVYPIEHLAFRVTSSAYSSLFEIEGCDISSSDGKLYFDVQRSKGSSDNDHDGICWFKDYTFTQTTSQTTHFTVKYDANGGTGSMSNSRVSYGYNLPLRKNTFTRDGWAFAGWTCYRHGQDQWRYTNGTSTGWYKEGAQPADYTSLYVYSDEAKIAKTTAIDNDKVTMYAQWTPLDKTYTVKYDPNGGKGTMADTVVVYGYDTPLRKNSYTRKGYQFLGWTAYRSAKGQWRYSNGTENGWYAEGSEPEGYYKMTYADQASVAKTTSVEGDTVYLYAQWELVCTHDYQGKVTTPATCTTAGVRTYTCDGCDQSYTETIAATGHDYASVVTAPTCTAEGYTTYTCRDCGDTYKGDVVGTIGHSYTSETTDATCTVPGATVHTCAGCGHSYSQTIPVKGHLFGDWYEAVAPGCTEQGQLVRVCATCGGKETQTIVATGHSYVGGTCTGCGQADPDAVKDPGLVLNYPTLSFEDEIIYNVYFSVKDTTSIVEMGLMVLPKMDQNATIEDAVALVPGYVTNGVAYLAKSEGIPAANMGDTLYFKVYAKLTDGSYAYSAAGGYNAKAYASSILSGNNTREMKALVVSMLNYGAEAQKFFDHNTDKLVNNALTAEQQALVKAYDATMMDALVKADASKITNFVRVNSNFRQLYPSVSFDGAFAINFYCVPTIPVDSGMTLYYWDMETMTSVEKLSIDNASGTMEMSLTGGIWWGQVAGIAAKQMDKTYYVTCVFESNGQTITTGVIPYSLGKYCSDKAAANGDAQQSFAQATAVYGYYAKNYFASIA